MSVFLGLILIAWAATAHDVGLLAIRPLVVTGQISYGLYLWHEPIINQVGPKLSHLGEPIAIAILVLLSYAAALVSYHLLELPFLRLKRRYSRHGDELAVGTSPVGAS